MTWVISIDESGNLGNDGRFFTMAAMIVMRPRRLMIAYKNIPQHRTESKFYNSTPSEIRTVLEALSTCEVEIVCVTVDKWSNKGKYAGFRGNKLYRAVLEEVLFDSLSTVGHVDVNVLLDNNSFIMMKDFRDLVQMISVKTGTNVKKSEKIVSHQSKCIQLVDYIAGAIERDYEDNCEDYHNLIRKKISVARRY